MNILIRADDRRSRGWIEDNLSDYSLTLFSAKTRASMLRLLEHTHIDAIIFATPALFRESLAALTQHAEGLPVVVCYSRHGHASELFNPTALKQMDAGKVFFIDDSSVMENRFKIELQRVIGNKRALSARVCPE